MICLCLAACSSSADTTPAETEKAEETDVEEKDEAEEEVSEPAAQKENEEKADEQTEAGGPEDAGTENPDEMVEITYEKALDGQLCVFIKNVGTEVIDELSVQAQFKDKEGTIIDVDKDGHDMILPGYTVVSGLDAPDEYETVEIQKKIELGVNPSYENHSENVSINAHDGANGIIVEITNNGDVEIEEIEYVLIYYLGDQIASVGRANDVLDVGAGETVVEEENPFRVDYDRYEVYLNQAHTFGL